MADKIGKLSVLLPLPGYWGNRSLDECGGCSMRITEACALFFPMPLVCMKAPAIQCLQIRGGLHTIVTGAGTPGYMPQDGPAC